jgi:hypothetical protein
MSTYSFEDEFNSEYYDSFEYEAPTFTSKKSDLTGKTHYAGDNEFEHKFKQRLLYGERIPQPITGNVVNNTFEGIGDRLKNMFSDNSGTGSREKFVTIPNWSVISGSVVGDGSTQGVVIRIVVILYIILFIMGLFIMKDLNEIRTDLKILNAKIK